MEKVIDISETDYTNIKKIIKKTWLSDYLIDRQDIICYKNKEIIVAFWRIFNIEWNDYELWSLYVDIKYRWKKLWIDLLKNLITHKYKKNTNLYLACKRELEEYYQKANFEQINKNIPEKLLFTLKWAKENSIDAIIMKYMYFK